MKSSNRLEAKYKQHIDELYSTEEYKQENTGFRKICIRFTFKFLYEGTYLLYLKKKSS